MQDASFGMSRDELRALLRQRPSYVLGKIALLFSLWIGLATLAFFCPSLWQKLALWCVLGFVINGIIQLAHDAWHGNLFPQRWQNTLFGNLLSLLVGIAYEPMRHDHLLHHQFNRTARDPDAYNAGRRSLGLVVLFYAVVLFGLPLSVIYFNVLYPVQHFAPAKLRKHWLLLAGYGVFYVLLFGTLSRLGWMSAAVELWLLPLLFASPWNGLKSISDHHANEWEGSRFRTATTVRSNAVVNFFWNGLNYHLDHHLFPRVPGYHLAKLHQHVRPRLLAEGSPVFDSYLAVMWAALRAGPQIVAQDVTLVSLSRKEPG
jgi:fatty acid desaturase